jgi:hypothetical protein
MCDNASDNRIEMVIEAESVFDAIDIVALEMDKPEEVDLIEAFPILD